MEGRSGEVYHPTSFLLNSVNGINQAFFRLSVKPTFRPFGRFFVEAPEVRKMKQTNPFYKTTKWKRKRQVILKRDEYMCRECKRYGKTTKAQVVHHVFPLEEYPNLKLNANNLISLCNNCHEQMHNKQTNEVTDVGKRWQERVSPLLFKDS